jgi:hypothetical protein
VWDPIAFRGIAAEQPTIVGYCQNTIGEFLCCVPCHAVAPPRPVKANVIKVQAIERRSVKGKLCRAVSQLYFAVFFSRRAVASREGCFLAAARRSIFLRRTARFLTLSLP